MCIKRNEQIHWCEREHSTSRKHAEVDQEWEQVDMDGYIGKINNDNSVIIYDVEERAQVNANASESQSEFSLIMLEYIQNKTAVAATYAAMEGEYLATVWIISKKRNEEEHIGGVESTKWNEGMIPARESIGLLELIKTIVKNTEHLADGEVTIFNDNKKLLREIEKEMRK